MTIWIVLGCVALVLVLLLLIPLGVKVDYNQDGFVLAATLGPITIPLYPRTKKKAKKRPKKEKKKSKKASPKAEASEEKEKDSQAKPSLSLGSWKTFRKYLPILCEAAGELRRKMVVRRLHIHLVWAGKNPAAAAIGYGMIHGVIGGIWNLIGGNFQVKDHKFVVDLDYDRQEPQVAMQMALSLRVGQIIGFALRYAKKIAAMQRKEREKTDNSKEVNHHE